MAKPGQSGLARVLSASRYSYQGLKAQWQHEAAFRQELCLFIIALPFALWLGDTALERAVLIFSVGMVLIVETLNSSVEAVVDRISDEHHELSGRAKDLGSAAVMLTLLLAVVVWCVVLIS
ncbi:diacylglycerol kinase [Marinomonas pollencensis]|uniref:Diacylglycerol kinase n=1 Tax=Marinomonas pollencensis TaxID=491954 RepID=A0A3E0DF50_9GAMM|nr:diacylglycerol kinase [Marinomonas pollencensis]REG81203.1 diacylglycerol kinase (ATP) [Marinomonas pollencensis]